MQTSGNYIQNKSDKTIEYGILCDTPKSDPALMIV